MASYSTDKSDWFTMLSKKSLTFMAERILFSLECFVSINFPFEIIIKVLRVVSYFSLFIWIFLIWDIDWTTNEKYSISDPTNWQFVIGYSWLRKPLFRYLQRRSLNTFQKYPFSISLNHRNENFVIIIWIRSKHGCKIVEKRIFR